MLNVCVCVCVCVGTAERSPFLIDCCHQDGDWVSGDSDGPVWHLLFPGRSACHGGQQLSVRPGAAGHGPHTGGGAETWTEGLMNQKYSLRVMVYKHTPCYV